MPISTTKLIAGGSLAALGGMAAVAMGSGSAQPAATPLVEVRT